MLELRTMESMSGFSHHQDQYLDGPEIEALRAGTFELDCPSITFARNSRSKSPSYSGPGSVSQTSEGNLHFKLYSNTPIDDFLYVELQTLAGTLLSEDRYYTLTLLDAAGREWICDSVPPFFEVVRTSNGAIVIGTIEELKTCVVRNDITERSFCEMRFFGDYIFPRNIPTKTITTIEDKIVEDSFHLNVAKVSTGKYEMQFKQENGYLLATVKTDSSEMPARLANRVAQALEFVLGQPTDYYILRSSENGKWSDSIRSVRYQDVRRGVPRPLQCNFVDPTGNFWKLFSCFLEHINLHSELIYPPLYRITHSLILSSNEPLDTQALTLSVAIEDLLATEFPDEGRPSEEFIADIKKAQALIESSDVSVTGKHRI